VGRGVTGGNRARRAAGPRFAAAEWRELVARHDGRCAYCGVEGKLEPDHRLPIKRGGSNSIENILPACGPCNRRKGALTEEEFRELRARGLREDVAAYGGAASHGHLATLAGTQHASFLGVFDETLGAGPLSCRDRVILFA